VRAATICVLAAAAVTAPAALATPGAGLRILRDHPAVVRGERFKDGERVTVVLFTTHRFVRAATANDQGTLTVRFSVSLPDCGRYTLQAFGSKGSRARSLAVRHVCGDPTQ
jgi:hypothetical protein